MDDVIVTTETIDLKDIIDELIKKFDQITEVFLFGSRAYRTNSTRSDIDLIIRSKELIAPEDLRSVYDKYEFCDLFYGSEDSINSVVNGSSISRKKLIKTLDAIKLWDCKNKYQNKEYYKQIINKYQRFVPSLGHYSAQFKAFKAKINNPALSSYCQFHFQESMVEYANENYVACVSFFGLSSEELLQKMVEGCEKKYICDYPGSTRDAWYVLHTSSTNHRRCAKNNLVALESYFASERSFFNSNGFNKLDEMLKTFDVIRNYRNDADHPSGFRFEKEYCDQLFGSLSFHMDLIINLIAFFARMYP